MVAKKTLVPWLLIAILTIAAAVYYFQFLSAGNISHEDEFLTLDRTSAVFAGRNYISIYTYNEPSFQKPPLQYYFSAWLYYLGFDLTFSLRFPSCFFSLLLLIVTPMLALYMAPGRIYAAPFAAALLAGSERFWTSGISALLDSGAALFCTLAVMLSFWALHNRKHLLPLAFVLGIGALQKTVASSAFAAAILLFGAITNAQARQEIMSKKSLPALVIYIVLLLSWPVLQFVQFGTKYIQLAFVAEVVDRYRPGSGESQRRELSRYLLAGEQVLRVPAFLSLLVLPHLARKSVLYINILIVFAIVLSIYIASGIVSPRHTLIVLPLLVGSLAAGIALLIPQRPGLEILAFLFFLLVTTGPFKNPVDLRIHNASPKDHQGFLQKVGAALQEQEKFVFCGWDIKGEDAIYRGEVSYFASKGRPFLILGGVEDATMRRIEGSLEGPLRGVCRRGQMQDLAANGLAFEVIDSAGDYVHWKGRFR